ncbi:MAG: PQQ-binding-like beta-propeller repeat protein [Pirellulales bacterium]
MGFVRRALWLALAVLALSNPWLGRSQAQGPFSPPTRFELSGRIQLDEADAAARTHLERVKAFVANEQWDEAVETLRLVSENHGEKVIELPPWQYISVRDYCHLQIAGLPPQALQLYRDRVDPQARKWYEQGVAQRDAEPLLAVVDHLFCSSWGDEALYALGELALEQGDHGNARGYWQKILPLSHWAEAAPPAAQTAGTPTWLVYPDSDLELAGVQARLLLVMIMEQDTELAREALAEFARQWGHVEGRLGGRKVNYAEALTGLLAASESWPRRTVSDDWPTFAGSPARSRSPEVEVEVGAPLWRQPLAKTPSADVDFLPRRVGEDKDQLLSYHPLLVGDLVLVNNVRQILAFDARTGQPAWGDDPIIFRDEDVKLEPRRGVRQPIGAARFTMTAFNNRLFARMGNPVTNSPDRMGRSTPGPGYVACLDLSAQGKLLWRTDRLVPPLDETWSFEGSPVSDGVGVYLAMRKSDVQPQLHVACFNIDTGRLRWRRMICGAETPAQGQSDEITHNLLTLDHGVLYCNTNLGAVAALQARDGRIKWITLYQRAQSGNLNDRATHFYRDLTPCVYDRGMLFVAPSDSVYILAFDAPTGLPVWRTDLPKDAVHLLGVSANHLLASGDKLWWIRLSGGKIAAHWPDGATPRGFGRGTLAGGSVYWPTRDTVYVFDQETAQPLPAIELATRGAVGGNLLVNRGSLLVTTSDELIAFSPQAGFQIDSDQAAQPPPTSSAANLQTPLLSTPPTGRPDQPANP